jgi:hypothetical protein
MGLEAIVLPREEKVIGQSVVSIWRKPGDPWDIGLMASFEGDRFSVAGVCINGNGRNKASDDNDWKDVCGRVVFRPLADDRFVVACRGYYGKIGMDRVPFWNVAGEFMLDRASFLVVGEVQHAMGRSPKDACYVQVSYGRFRLLEPVIRFHTELLAADNYGFGGTGGLNFRVLGDHLKVMLGYDYWCRRSSKPSERSSEQEILLRLQAAF